jgi:hypothetical protein
MVDVALARGGVSLARALGTGGDTTIYMNTCLTVSATTLEPLDIIEIP